MNLSLKNEEVEIPMICAAISANDTQSAILKGKKAIQEGATYVEIRIDHFKDPFAADFPNLVKNIDSKIILTIRKPDEGGKYAFNEKGRHDLITPFWKALRRASRLKAPR